MFGFLEKGEAKIEGKYFDTTRLADRTKSGGNEQTSPCDKTLLQ